MTKEIKEIIGGLKRVSKRQLDDVCLDCCDLLNQTSVKCCHCPVSRLKGVTNDQN